MSQRISITRWLTWPVRKLTAAAGGLSRGSVLLIAAGAAAVLIAFLTLVLGRDSASAVFWLDYASDSRFPYPLTIQNGMLVAFFVGLGELIVRWNFAEREHACLAWGLLPEDDRAVLQADDLPPIRKTLAERPGGEGFLPRLLDLCILQFLASRSVDQTVSVLNSSLELQTHRLDLRYTVTRYLIWLIPTVGFIGTVVGIAGALEMVDPSDMDIASVTASLGVAFNTTIIALLMSAVLVFAQHLVQQHEETALNQSADYCLVNFINRLYVEP